MVPPAGSRGPGGAGAPASDPGHGSDPSRDRSVRCEASRNLKWSITNTGIHAPVYKLTLPNPDAPGSEQPLFQISKPNPNANWWSLFYFTYAGHLIPPKRIEFGRIQKNSGTTGGGTRVTITGKSPEEKAVWQTLGEGNEDMVEWIVLCAALNVLDEEIIKAAEKSGPGAVAGAGAGPSRTVAATAVPSSRPTAGARGALKPTAGPVPRNAGPAPVSNAPPTNYTGRAITNPGAGGGGGGGQMRPPQQGMPARGPSPNTHPGYGSPMQNPQSMRGMPPGARPPQQQQQPQGYPQGYGQQAPPQGYRGPPPPQQQQQQQGYPMRGPPPQQQQQQMNGRRF